MQLIFALAPSAVCHGLLLCEYVNVCESVKSGIHKHNLLRHQGMLRLVGALTQVWPARRCLSTNIA